MAYYLGVDGGQSTTTALIADGSGRILGSGSGGPCNHVSGPEAVLKFRRVVGDCLEQACAQAALDPAHVSFAAACLGFSGGPDDKDAYSRELIRSTHFKITHDAEIALSGATAGEPGIIVIAGTGSISFGRNAQGRSARTGGWGYIFGDEGGAFDLVRRALRAALEMEEGWGPETTLRASLLEASKASSAQRLLYAFYTPAWPRSRAATLAPLVTEAAESGDPIARAIVADSVERLARYVVGVYRNLFSGEIVPVAHIGGVFRSLPILRAFETRISAALQCPVVPPRYNPACGALLEALRLDGNPATLSGMTCHSSSKR